MSPLQKIVLASLTFGILSVILGNANRFRGKNNQKVQSKGALKVKDASEPISFEEQSGQSSMTWDELKKFAYSPSGLDMSSKEAETYASSEYAKMTQLGITVPMLEAMRKMLYSPSGLDLSKKEIPNNLLKLAYQQVDPEALQKMFKALYFDVDLKKDDARSRAMELTIKQVNPDRVKAVYKALYHDANMKKAESQQQALVLAWAGADPKTVGSAFRRAESKGWDRNLEVVTPTFDGTQRRYYSGDAKPYTAKEFYDYLRGDPSWFESWLSAPQEQHVANDYKAYTMDQFNEFFGNVAKWSSSPEATQQRMAEDGSIYTMAEFKSYYKEQWQNKWFAAAVAPCKECQ